MQETIGQFDVIVYDFREEKEISITHIDIVSWNSLTHGMKLILVYRDCNS